ncbi:hypothetical protein L596_024388 [Steinernema carpocapsae]|uniref:Uncharacterized protein n=1 Tax=Steinernema carpocapsae TaxID=34508 RepID=A0A4U5MGL4_STECR|nr:hypothetical protein L596_024388 [Steinernema carpocapsae]
MSWLIPSWLCLEKRDVKCSSGSGNPMFGNSKRVIGREKIRLIRSYRVLNSVSCRHMTTYDLWNILRSMCGQVEFDADARWSQARTQARSRWKHADADALQKWKQTRSCV